MQKIKGTSNRYLDINLTDQSWSVYTVSHEDLSAYLGAKGLALKIYHDRFPKDQLNKIDPLGAENLLIFSMGVMLSTGVPSSARFEVVTKSPLTGLMVGSSCGGPFGEACKTAGWDGAIISGKANEPLMIKLDNNGVSFEPAGTLWGQGTQATQEMLKLTREEGAAVIGPAGENGVLYANICSGHRFAGRGGVGTVMGAKNLKAIVASGKKVRYEAVLPGKFTANRDKARKYVKRNWMTKAYSAYGTNSNVRYGIKGGFSPVHNFRDRYHPDTEMTSGETIAEKYKTKQSGCRQCPILCGHKGTYPDGKTRIIPEYETTGMFGSNIDNYDTDLIGYWNELLNELGMDSISAGGTLAWAMEAGEKGLRKTALEFGKSANIEKILNDIAYQKGEGKELSLGTKRLSAKYGGKNFAIQVKGMECAAYDPRASWGHGLGTAVHNKGGCHLGSYLISLEHQFGYMPRHTALSKAHWVVFMEDIFTAVNSLQVCIFSVFGILTEPPIPKYLPKFVLNVATMLMPKAAIALMDWSILSTYFWSITGIKMSKWDLLHAGKRINRLERWMNVQMGMKKEDDTLPDRFTQEKETAYPGKNTVVPIHKMVKKYYRLRRYTDTGGPLDQDIKESMKIQTARKIIRPRKQPFKKIYCIIIFFVLGWFIPNIACRKKSVRELVSLFPKGFSFRLGVWPKGPSVAFLRRGDRLKKIHDKNQQVEMTVNLKSIEAAWLLFSFQESTCQSEAKSRLTVTGALPHTCTFIRLMDKVEILLLPKFIAKKAVKRWEKVI
jgi:aldehyde:ferredoxin oxidoreductase